MSGFWKYVVIQESQQRYHLVEINPLNETCENWLGLVNNCIYYADQTYEIYQVLLYSVDFKAPGDIWNPLSDWWISLPKGQ